MNLHRIGLYTFILTASGVLFGVFYGRYSWSWLAVVVLAYLVVLAIGTLKVGWRYYMPLRNHGPREKKQVALTFDDGPDQFTSEVADCLNRHGVVGTFFVIGQKAVEMPEVLRELDSGGHLIANHGYYHQWHYPLQFPHAMRKEMQRTSAAIEQATGRKTRWFRPPFGITNPWVAKAVREESFVPIGWDVRSFDTVLGTSERLSSRLKKRVKSGSIILLHDTGEGLVRFLDKFIPWLKEQGFQIVSLENLIHEKAYR